MSDPTIKDVAKDACVSVGTVSKVLHNQYVKPENRRRVESSIKRLNYTVNTYARGLREKQTFTVAVVVPDLINPFFAELVHYTELILSSMGYRLLVCNSQCRQDREAVYFQMAVQNKIDGIIAITYSILNQRKIRKIPLVLIDRNLDPEGKEENLCCVTCDNYRGGELAAKHLISDGCQNVLYLRNGSTLLGTETLKRGKAFLSVCSKAGIRAKEVDFGQETTLKDENVNTIRDFLKKSFDENGRFQYDGIFTSSDIHAVIVKRELKREGISIPEQVEIIGFDGLRELNYGDYIVSSIAQPIREIAMEAADSLIKMINHEHVQRVKVLPVKFVEGGTTKFATRLNSQF